MDRADRQLSLYLRSDDWFKKGDKLYFDPKDKPESDPPIHYGLDWHDAFHTTVRKLEYFYERLNSCIKTNHCNEAIAHDLICDRTEYHALVINDYEIRVSDLRISELGAEIIAFLLSCETLTLRIADNDGNIKRLDPRGVFYFGAHNLKLGNHWSKYRKFRDNKYKIGVKGVRPL